MKALTIWQPYASALLRGTKEYETRSWAPPDGLIGEHIAIHAAARKPRMIDGSPPPRGHWPTGCVIGSVRLAGAGKIVARVGGIITVECWHGDHVAVQADDIWSVPSVGRWVWFVDERSELPVPLPAIGQQKLWNWEYSHPTPTGRRLDIDLGREHSVVSGAQPV